MKVDLISQIESTSEIPLIIAELGINHQGSLEVAQELIFGAYQAGVHAVKFQYRNLDRVYLSKTHEIGDELLETEIKRNFLPPKLILSLVAIAKKSNLSVGISFFHLEDCEDFGDDINQFDFFKIPSAELLNFELTDYLTSLGRPVLISTGMHWEHEIVEAFSRLDSKSWFPMHCISNYPVALHNSNFSYISHLRRRWGRPSGFSSHEAEWEHLLLALHHAPRIIERHITVDKSEPGLDQSASSTVPEFAKLIEILHQLHPLPSVEKVSRVPNQGELLNRQNLGRSLYFSTAQKAGSTLNETTLVYRSPKVGLNASELQGIKTRSLLMDGFPGHPLVASHLLPKLSLGERHLSFLEKYQISLPARLHDIERLNMEIPCSRYELHLSYSEIPQMQEFLRKVADYSALSVHLPDYVDSLNLIDPFSFNDTVKGKSLQVIDQVSKFVEAAQQELGKQIPIVGSFPTNHPQGKEFFYSSVLNLVDLLKSRNVFLSAQWLPPFAWYFGGSYPIDVFNHTSDLDFIKGYGIPICMDTSHLLLGSKFFDFDEVAVLEALSGQISYFHLSDAVGLDGEGTHFDIRSPIKQEFFTQILDRDCVKVIEVWQGHIDEFQGFKRAIIDLFTLKGGDAGGTN